MTSESAFFYAFLEEGLRFSSSSYLCLIWICVLCHVFENPNEAAEYLKSHPFFNEFASTLSTDAYVDGLCNSLQSISIGSSVIRSTEKCRLSEMLMDKSSSDDEIPRTKSELPSRVSQKMMPYLELLLCPLQKLYVELHLLKRNILLELDCIARQKIMLYLQLLQ